MGQNSRPNCVFQVLGALGIAFAELGGNIPRGAPLGIFGAYRRLP